MIKKGNQARAIRLKIISANLYILICHLIAIPVFSIPIGDWDIRRAVIAGKGDKLMRYFDKVFEEASTMIRLMQADGQNATQLIVIFDVSSFSLGQHSCPRCKLAICALTLSNKLE